MTGQAVASSRAKPVAVVVSISAGLNAVVGVAGLADLIGVKAALILVLVNVGLTAGLGAWLQQNVVPLENVAARVPGDPELSNVIVGGPALRSWSGSSPTSHGQVDKPVTVQALAA